MTIGDPAFVRRLIGNIESQNVSDDDIQKGIDFGISELYSVTFKDDWATDTSHPLFDKAEAIVHYFASFYCLDRFSGNFQKADVHYTRATNLKAAMKTEYEEYLLVTGGDGGGGGGGSSSRFGVLVSSYKTFPINEDAEVYRSPTIIPGD